MTQPLASGTPEPDVESRYRGLSPRWRRVVAAAAGAVLLASVARTFELPVPGPFLQPTHFFYLVAALLLPLVPIVFPARAGRSSEPVGMLNAGLGVAMLVVLGACTLGAERIYDEAWEYAAPGPALVLAVAGWLLLLEAGRRAGGWPILVVAFALSLYPLYAGELPALLDGLPYSFLDTVAFHLFSAESFQGIPMRAFADWAVGYLFFGAVLQWTGGGQFFLELTFALLGRHRGGPAKVAIFASGMMGSMSGSVVSNVLTTGALTVPAMRRSGFSSHYAAGVEACASTGGVLMPPIMGAAAFVMARYLQVPYSQIAIAALLPSLLYFYGLFMQIDAYAARHGLLGLEAPRLPALGQTLRTGWPYLASFALLVWLLLGLHWHQQAPYLAAAALLVLRGLHSGRRAIAWREVEDFLVSAGVQLAELIGVLAPIGVIIGALMMTGTIGNFTYDMVSIAGTNVLLLLVLGALTSFVLGIGMTVVAAYTFLAITLAPILVRVGVEPMAAHMFILYWGMLSYITPPVAIGAYAAAGLAGASPMRTALEAMRLGSVIYFVPFFFVLSPTLLLQGAVGAITVDLVSAVLGITLIAGALQGYLVLIGELGRGPAAWLGRGLTVLAGLALAVPSSWLGVNGLVLAAAAVALAAAGLGACRLAPPR